MARELYTARLLRKDCISEVAQCYHFLFSVESLETFPYLPGQFVSAVAPDENGKQQTRAYSIASAPSGNQFELCVNRVENGFFSNHLADLPDLPVGSTIQIHGPHGHFVLQEPITDSIFVATGTGIAPMRGYAQWLFPADGPDRSNGKEIWLVYGTRYETDIYYHDEFEALAQRVPNFHYLPTLSRAQPELDRPARLRAGSCRQNCRRARRAPGPAVACAARRSRNPARGSALRHLHLHLRPEFHGLERARAPGRLRLAQKADCLRALRLRSCYRLNNSRSRLVCARLTGISVCCLSFMRSW